MIMNSNDLLISLKFAGELEGFALGQSIYYLTSTFPEEICLGTKLGQVVLVHDIYRVYIHEKPLIKKDK